MDHTSLSLCSMVTVQPPCFEGERKGHPMIDSMWLGSMDNRKQQYAPSFGHGGSHNHQTPLGIFQRVIMTGNGNSILRCIHVPVDNVILAANEHSRRPTELL